MYLKISMMAKHYIFAGKLPPPDYLTVVSAGLPTYEAAVQLDPSELLQRQIEPGCSQDTLPSLPKQYNYSQQNLFSPDAEMHSPQLLTPKEHGPYVISNNSQDIPWTTARENIPPSYFSRTLR